MSTLFFFTVNHNEDFKDSHRPIFDPIPQTYSLPGPPLAVTSFGTSASSLSVAVSIDLRGSPASTEDADSAMVSTKEQPLRRFEWIAAEGRWEFRPGTKFDAPLPEKDVQFAHLLDEALAVEPLRKREGDFISGN